MTNLHPTEYAADWASPPGDTIKELLDDRQWTQAELAKRLGYTQKHINDLIKSRASITPDAAERLERVFGVSARFWLQLQSNYQQDLFRLEQLERLSEQADWLKEIPFNWMVKNGWVEASTNVGIKVKNCLKFFSVASVDAWRQQYKALPAAYRSSTAYEKKAGSVACWLRRAEIEALKIECKPYSEKGFRDCLHEIRGLTLEPNPEIFVPKLRERAASSGVAVVFIPTPPGCPVSGATSWLSPTKALIALSLRYKSDDHLWFTFFHEAGHILLHNKLITFLEGLNGLDKEKEDEANKFAADLLIPRAAAKGLNGLAGAVEVSNIAQRLGVSPGVVVGRMQHEGWLPRSHLNKLKKRYKWVSAAQLDPTE